MPQSHTCLLFVDNNIHQISTTWMFPRYQYPSNINVMFPLSLSNRKCHIENHNTPEKMSNISNTRKMSKLLYTCRIDTITKQQKKLKTPQQISAHDHNVAENHDSTVKSVTLFWNKTQQSCVHYDAVLLMWVHVHHHFCLACSCCNCNCTLEHPGRRYIQGSRHVEKESTKHTHP